MSGNRMKAKRKRPGKVGTLETRDKVNLLEELQQYEIFRDLPKDLRAAVTEGRPAPELYQKYSHIAAVRAVHIAMTEQDSGKALSAIKDIMDRTYGKATERKEVRHKFDDLSDEELDAILISELDEQDD